MADARATRGRKMRIASGLSIKMSREKNIRRNPTKMYQTARQFLFEVRFFSKSNDASIAHLKILRLNANFEQTSKYYYFNQRFFHMTDINQKTSVYEINRFKKKINLECILWLFSKHPPQLRRGFYELF